jgi:hypothetical protein
MCGGWKHIDELLLTKLPICATIMNILLETQPMDIMKPNFCRSCGQSTVHSDIFCWNCGYQLKSRAAQKPGFEQVSNLELGSPQTNELSGIKGWLAWFTVGVALTPLMAAYGLFMDVISFSVVASQGFAVIAVAEILANIALITLAIWGLILLHGRRKRAAKIFISLMLVSLAISIIDQAFVFYLQQHYALTNSTTQTMTTIRSLLTAIIWIPYFVRSRRVKATLVA